MSKYLLLLLVAMLPVLNTPAVGTVPDVSGNMTSQNVTANVTLREFPSAKFAEEWLEENALFIRMVSDETGWWIDKTYDCDDYALDLQARALNDGYLMSVQLVQDGMIFNKPVSRIGGKHIGCLVVIGNDIYYVESIPPHDMVWVCRRD